MVKISRVRNLRVNVFVPNRYLCFIGGISCMRHQLGSFCILMKSTCMELSSGDITHKVCRSFKWEFWQWKLQKHLAPDLFIGQRLFIYQIEEQSLPSLFAKNWVNLWSLHLLLHDFPNQVYSDLLWKLDHGSAEPRLAGHRCIKVLLFTLSPHTHKAGIQDWRWKINLYSETFDFSSSDVVQQLRPVEK